MHLVRHRRLIDSRLVVLLVASLLWLVADNLLEFVFPTYLDGAGKSYLEIGALISLAALSGLVIDLPMGSLSDRASRKKLMVSGLVLLVVGGVMIFSFKASIPLAIAFFVWGIAYQVWRVPRDACFASLTNRQRRAEFCGFDAEIKYLGQTIGPALGGFVLMYLGFSGIVGVYGALVAAAALVLLLFMKETNHRPLFGAVSASARVKALAAELKELRRLGLFGAFLLYFSLLFAAWEAVLWTLEPLLYGPDVLNIPPHLGGLLLAFFSLPGIFLAYPAGKIADKFGKRNALLLGLAITGASIILFSVSNDLLIVFASALFFSAGWVFSLPALNGLIIDLAYRRRKGEIAGIWDFFTDAGFVAGPVVGGAVAEFWGIRQTFLAAGIVFLASAALVLAAGKSGRGSGKTIL